MAGTGRDLNSHPAVRNYTLLCLGALLLVSLGLVQADQAWGALVLVLLGTVALLLRWSIGPPLLLVALVCVLVGEARTRYFRRQWLEEPSPLGDLALCVGMLGYVAGHYRLQALVRSIRPPDPRARAAVRWWTAEARRAKAGPAFPAPPPDLAAPPRRSADLVGPNELLWLVGSFPVWAGLALLVWNDVEARLPPLGMAQPAYRALVVFGVAVLGLAVTAAAHGYLGRALAGTEENVLALQDQVWRETRGEQTRLNRWLTWARLRGQRRKEKR